MMRFPATKTLVVALLGGALSGCGGSGDFADLQAFIDEVDSRPKGAIEPLPSFKQVEPFAYRAGAMRSPFEPPLVLAETPDKKPTKPPSAGRVKQYLEQFSISSLAMVGTLSQGESMFALIQDADGGVHRVKRGDYMGTDYGEVQSIAETELELRETVSDGRGNWVERIRTVSLNGSNRG
jgi:type IV pilus assembly protein PilP